MRGQGPPAATAPPVLPPILSCLARARARSLARSRSRSRTPLPARTASARRALWLVASSAACLASCAACLAAAHAASDAAAAASASALAVSASASFALACWASALRCLACCLAVATLTIFTKLNASGAGPGSQFLAPWASTGHFPRPAVFVGRSVREVEGEFRRDIPAAQPGPRAR